jgi:DNA-binding MarR family transcriptional regulator
MSADTVLLANALRDIAWLLPRTLGRAPSPARLLPRSELEVMRLLTNRPGLSVNETAAELEIQPPNVSTAVRSLVEKGLLERCPNPADRRSVELHPTPQALSDRADQEQAWGQALEAVMDGLETRDRTRLTETAAALSALADALSGSAYADSRRDAP